MKKTTLTLIALVGLILGGGVYIYYDLHKQTPAMPPEVFVPQGRPQELGRTEENGEIKTRAIFEREEVDSNLIALLEYKIKLLEDERRDLLFSLMERKPPYLWYNYHTDSLDREIERLRARRSGASAKYGGK